MPTPGATLTGLMAQNLVGLGLGDRASGDGVVDGFGASGFNGRANGGNVHALFGR